MKNKKVNRTIKDETNQQHTGNFGKPPIGQTPLDPTDNAQGMMNDTSGMTGISKDANNPNTPPPQGNEPGIRTWSEHKSQVNRDVPTQTDDPEVSIAESPITSTPGSTPTGNETLDEKQQPHVQGEQSINATNPDPASDDDTLANAHNVGLRLDEDEEHPQELDIGSDIDKAEEYHRNH